MLITLFLKSYILNGALSLRKNSLGKGSKNKIYGTRLFSLAIVRSFFIIAWCPRCTPSKEPIAIALGRGSLVLFRFVIIFIIKRRFKANLFESIIVYSIHFLLKKSNY